MRPFKASLIIGISLLVIAIVAAVASAIIFIYPYEPKRPPKTDVAGWTWEGVREVVFANNRFALELYSELSKRETGNIFFSPYSISSALAIVYEGARGETADEIRAVFHFPDYEVLRPNFAEIYNSINKNYSGCELRTGNALWVQEGFPLLESYRTVVERYYGGKAANLDFVRETEKSRQTINSFIEEQTNGKIKDLIPPDFLNSQTALVVTNAIYFKGAWLYKFDPTETREMDFKTSTGIVKVPMMCMPSSGVKFKYAELENLQILELPYSNGNVSMLILLPKADLSSIEPLTIEKLEEWKSEMKETVLDAIYLPKFEFETKYLLNDYLKTLGMPTAFNPHEADFSGMSPIKVWIDFVIHQAYVEVDEKGTEAAAATAAGMTLGINKIFMADHPFIFIIQQNDTGNILFLGRVVNPNQ
jgi:serpin B